MRKLIVLGLLVLAVGLRSQVKPGGTYKEYFQEGSFLMLEDNYALAEDNFEAAYELDSSSANINYVLGVCLLHSPVKKGKAEQYLAKAVTNVSRAYRSDDFSE